MELNHLKYFYAVAREGSFTRASKVLRIQQPTISKMVAALERDLSLVLLERYKKGVRLTKAGGEIFRMCEDIFSRVEAIKTLSDSEHNECQGILSFGMTDSATSYVLPKVLRGFLAKHPKVRPSVFAGSSNLITNEVTEARVEFGIFFTRVDRQDLHVSDIVDVPFQLVASPKLSRKPEARSAFVISRDVDYPKARPFPVLEMLKRHRLKVDVMIASNNLDSQKQMVMEGLGVALLPGFMVRREIEKGTLVALSTKKKFSYSLKLVTRARKVLSLNAAVFLEEFRAGIREML